MSQYEWSFADVQRRFDTENVYPEQGSEFVCWGANRESVTAAHADEPGGTSSDTSVENCSNLHHIRESRVIVRCSGFNT